MSFRRPNLLETPTTIEIVVRDHLYITSAKKLGGWGQKNGKFMLIFSTIYTDVGWVGQKKSNKLSTDVI